MQVSIRRWFLSEDSWVITLGLGLVVVLSLLFLLGFSSYLGPGQAVLPLWSSLTDLGNLLGARAVFLAIVFINMLLVTSLSARGMGLPVGDWIKGFSCLWLLVLVSFILGAWSPLKDLKMEGPLVALFLGFLLSNVCPLPTWIRMTLRGEFWLKLGIVLMGATLPFTVLLNAGPVAIGQSLLVSCFGFAACFYLGRRFFKLDNKMAATLAGGLAVGNITGIIACAEASRAKLQAISTGFILIVISSVALMLVLTSLSEWWGLPASLVGAWIGSSETADVAGFAALSAINDDVALQSYTLVKVIGRDMGIVIWTLFVAIWAVKFWDRDDENRIPHTPLAFVSEVWRRFPKFILGLFGASIFTALMLQFLPADLDPLYHKEVLGLLKDIRGWFFSLCFLSIGMSTRIHDIRSIGWRPAGAFTLSVIMMTSLGYILSIYIFKDFWMAL